MKICFLGFGLCVGMALGSFVNGNIITGIIQLGCALMSVPGMLDGGNE